MLTIVCDTIFIHYTYTDATVVHKEGHYIIGNEFIKMLTHFHNLYTVQINFFSTKPVQCFLFPNSH